MASGGVLLSRLAVLVVVAGFAASSFVAADELNQAHGSTGRRLLQTKTSCPVNFEFLNYTGLITQCKGPQYPASLCCDAFLKFACPYYPYLNDQTNDCASTMFSYINLYGQYPPGLFSSECTGGQKGLSCPANYTTSTSEKKTTNFGSRETALTSMVLFVSGVVFLVLLS